MKYISISPNVKSVSLIGQGCSNVGKKEDVDYESIIKLGIDRGMNFIDTAECYTEGKSESIIGNVINKIRDKVFLCTKVSAENLSFDNVLLSAENSLRRLRTDFIDLYMIHWPNNKIDINETMDAFDKLFYDKKVRFFGISNYSYPSMEEIVHNHANRHSFGRFMFNQIEYGIFYRYAEDIIRFCNDHTMNNISYSPLNRGNIIPDDNKMKILNNFSEKYNKSIFQISLNWLSSKNIISIPSSSTRDHIIENSESTDFVIDQKDMDVIDKEIVERVEYIEPNAIKVIKEGYGNHNVYYTKEEAVSNKYDFCPSPLDISNWLMSLSSIYLNRIQPIRVILNTDSDSDIYPYKLHEGRVRYWGWVIAFGNNKEIPAYIIKG